MCAPDPPPAPDYAAAAQSQGAANIDAAIAQGLLGNPEFTNAFGSREVAFDPSRNYTVGEGENQRTVPGISITDTLSPIEQQKLTAQNNLSLGLLDTAQTGLNAVDDVLGTPYDSSGLPPITTPLGPGGLQIVSDALLQRLEPQFQDQQARLETQLINQGFARGSEGFDKGMDQHLRALNDARLAALAQAGGEQSRVYGAESSERGRALQEAMYLRQLPLTEVNSLRTGNQPTVPQFQTYQGAGVNAAPIFQAASLQDQANMQRYNAQAANSGNLMSGLFSLGGAALGSPWLGAAMGIG